MNDLIKPVLLVDADACPVKNIIVSLAKEFQLDVFMFFDTAHEYEDGYSTSIQLDKGFDSVDYAIVNRARTNDIVITQDYGLASMALGKGAQALHTSGRIFQDDNILGLLTRRAIGKKTRHKHMKGPKKRTPEDDQRFESALRSLINNI